MTLNKRSDKKPKIWEYTVDSGDVTGGSDTVQIPIDTTVISGRAFNRLVQVRSSAGIAKPGITQVYSTVTGILSLTEGADTFAAGDIITVIGALNN